MSSDHHPFDVMTEPELRKLFSGIAEVIKYHLPKHTGFILLATPFDGEARPGGVAQYVSNCDRATAAAWMRETISRWTSPDDDTVPRVGS